MSSINTIQGLLETADWHTGIQGILEDYSLGRRKAAEKIYSDYAISVSDKLVRMWRDAKKSEIPNKDLNTMVFELWKPTLDSAYAQAEIFTMPLIDGHTGRNHNPITYQVPDQPVTSSPITNTTNPVKPGKAVSSGKRVIAFGDFQINKHDPEFIAKTVKMLEDQQPDMICLTGDESDNSAVGRHAQGLKEEFQSNLQGQINETVMWLRAIREAAPNAKIMMAHSNHMNWINKALETRLPGALTLDCLTPEELYKLDELEISYERKLFEFLPNYLLGHGHQWNLTSASHKTKGIEHVMRTGCSILAGHVHQATLQTVFIGYEGKGEQKVYANPGCMMDFEKAMESNGGYIGGTSPNWSKGIVVITREAGQNYTELVLGQNDGSFRYENRIY